MFSNPKLLWSVSAVFPIHDWAHWSKNRMWRHGKGRPRLAPGARGVRDAISVVFRQKLTAEDHLVRHNRFWVGLHVAKETHKGDAINALDIVCDGITRATGLDDNWYSVLGIDWSIDKENPHVEVVIGQEDLQDSIVCGACGKILPFEDFGRLAKGRHGRATTCRRCASARRRRYSEERKRLKQEDSPPAIPDEGEEPPWI